MRKILLSDKIHYTIVDDESYELIKNFKLHYKTSGYCYFRTKTNNKVVCLYLHRYLMNIHNKKLQIDHINRNKLDNRKSNLRICTNSENQKNKKSSGKSKYLGVYIQKNNRIYIKKNGEKRIYTYINIIAHIKANGKYIHLGCFETEKDAALAYNNAAKKYHGEFANLNNV